MMSCETLSAASEHDMLSAAENSILLEFVDPAEALIRRSQHDDLINCHYYTRAYWHHLADTMIERWRRCGLLLYYWSLSTQLTEALVRGS